MVLGDTCTRACRFCHIKTGNPQGVVDATEPQRVADSVRVMDLRYVVITMVDRDDLSDGGAAHLAAVVQCVREVQPQIKVELLTSDFAGQHAPLDTLSAVVPEVLAHNVETVARLTPRVRDRRAAYRTSLQVLRNFKRRGRCLFSKSALMLGLGETRLEVEQTLRDLREQEVDIVTIGQYMRPTRKHLSVKELRTTGGVSGTAGVCTDTRVCCCGCCTAITQQLSGCRSICHCTATKKWRVTK